MRRTIIIIAALLGLLEPSSAQSPPTVINAEDGIFQAFRAHPLVGMREAHGLAQELDFYSALIRDPRFPSEVGNVVMELGDAAYQNVIDRFVNGEYVPYNDLRKVWADTVAYSPTANVLGTINVYAAIREVNLKLPVGHRIKVWLGDPPTDWSKIKSKDDLAPLQAQRNSFPASLIEKEILDKGKKALVIYGADHLRTGVFAEKDNLLSLIQRSHPEAFYLVVPFGGYLSGPCADRFNRHVADWPTPALITPVRGTSWEKDIWQSGCDPVKRFPQTPAEQWDALMQDYFLTADGILYIGPRDRMTVSPTDPDLYLDLDFRAEIDRRNQIRTGKKLTGGTSVGNPATPTPFQ